MLSTLISQSEVELTYYNTSHSALFSSLVLNAKTVLPIQSSTTVLVLQLAQLELDNLLMALVLTAVQADNGMEQLVL